MLYNLRIGKTRYTGKTIDECRDIIAANSDRISAATIAPVLAILADVRTMGGKYKTIRYFDNAGKVFVSINKKGEN